MKNVLLFLCAILGAGLGSAQQPEEATPHVKGSTWIYLDSVAISPDQLVDAWLNVETGQTATTDTKVTFGHQPLDPTSGAGGPQEFETTWDHILPKSGSVLKQTVTTKRGGLESMDAFAKRHHAAVAALMEMFPPNSQKAVWLRRAA